MIRLQSLESAVTGEKNSCQGIEGFHAKRGPEGRVSIYKSLITGCCLRNWCIGAHNTAVKNLLS